MVEELRYLTDQLAIWENLLSKCQSIQQLSKSVILICLACLILVIWVTAIAYKVRKLEKLIK